MATETENHRRRIDENNLLTYTETEEAKTAVISYAAVRPVQDVEITLNFADPNLSALNKTYLLSTITEEDRQGFAKCCYCSADFRSSCYYGKN